MTAGVILPPTERAAVDRALPAVVVHPWSDVMREPRAYDRRMRVSSQTCLRGALR
jgi:hypothetical protein